MKKLIIILIVVSLLFVFSACSGKSGNFASQDAEPPASSTESEAESSMENNQEISEESEETSDSSASTETVISFENDPESVEEQVLYDKDDIVVKVTDFGSILNMDSEFVVGDGAWLNFSVDNNSQMDIEVSSILTSINGYMIQQMYFNVFLDAGQSSDEGYMAFNLQELKEINIAKVKEISFILNIRDQADLFGENPINISMHTVTTSADPNYKQPDFIPDGTVIMDKEGFKVYSLNHDPVPEVVYFYVYFENTTDKIVQLDFDNAKADGSDISKNTYCFNNGVFPNSKAIILISVQQDDEDYSGPKIIENLKGTINVHPYGDAEIILASQDVEI